jgi:hypothetical protein
MVCENGVQPGRPYDKTCHNTHVDKLLDTGVVEHPVEEYITRAQMTHEAPFDEADMPSVDVSIFFGSVC